MPIQQKHGKGGNPLLVHEDVAALIERVNALENMILIVTLPSGVGVIRGKLDVGTNGCVLSGR